MRSTSEMKPDPHGQLDAPVRVAKAEPGEAEAMHGPVCGSTVTVSH